MLAFRDELHFFPAEIDEGERMDRIYDDMKDQYRQPYPAT